MNRPEALLDFEYQEHVLEGVEADASGYTLKFDDSMCLGCPKVEGIIPKPGDTVRLWGRGFGYTVRGIAINGQIVRYETATEEKARHAREQAERDQQKRDEFAAKRQEYDAQYAALPAVFQRRLDRFRAGNPDFRWDFEPYEMMVCVDAVAVAEAMRSLETGRKLRAAGIKTKDDGANWPDTPEGRLQAFSAINSDVNGYRYAVEREIVPALSDGHSGNSHGMMLRLAWWYLTKPENVAREHGALVPLVGCDSYGCTHVEA